MGTGQWWSDADRMKAKYLKKNLSKLHFSQDESQMNRPGFETMVFAVGGLRLNIRFME